MMQRFFLLCCFLICGLTCFGQIPFFQQYTLLPKKNPVQINAMFQDKQGFIWLGTEQGLFKFDGQQHIRFTTKESLQDDHVTAIAADSLGRIWIGYRNGKISWLEKGSFKNFEPKEGTPC